MSNTYGNFIGGKWVEADQTIESINPSDTRDIIGVYANASVAQMEDAVAAARHSLPAWSATTTQQRSDILGKVSAEILASKEALGELVSRESGKTRAEGQGEVVRAAQVFNFFSGEAIRYGGENVPSTRENIGIQISRDPVGVVVAITPWNFPIAIPAWKLAPALAFGNTAVLKPSEFTPGVAVALIKIMERCGVPAGVVNLVNGTGAAAADGLLKHIDAVSFTGSVATGHKVAQAAVSRMIRVQLEMGGKNPLVVMDDADLDVAVECALNGAFFSAGQRCTASSRLIVTEKIHDQFIDALQKRMRAIKVGPALAADTTIGPVINQQQLDKIIKYVDIGKREGGNLLQGGMQIDSSTPGFYMAPTLFTETGNTMRINREEVFGPFASIIRVRDYEEALFTANDTDFGLSSGICTTSLKYANHFRLNIKSGLTMINLPTAGLDYHVPFGGVKGSSYGQREQGQYAVDFYTNIKTAYIGY